MQIGCARVMLRWDSHNGQMGSHRFWPTWLAFAQKDTNSHLKCLVWPKSFSDAAGPDPMYRKGLAAVALAIDWECAAGKKSPPSKWFRNSSDLAGVTGDNLLG